MKNLADETSSRGVREELEGRLEALLAERKDALVPCSSYRDWFDSQRRVVRNAYGPLGDPEKEPDWSLLR